MTSLKNGLPNLMRHVENINTIYGLPVVVALNRFGTDTDAELDLVKTSVNVPVALTEVFAKGGEGGKELAKAVMAAAEKPSKFSFAYDLDRPLKEKIETIAKRVYRASGVSFEPEASRMLRRFEKDGYGKLPICIAKTQYSFSDNPKLLGAPTGFEVKIRRVKLSAGAGFVVALAGDIMTMPGLPPVPAAESIDVSLDGVISGLF